MAPLLKKEHGRIDWNKSAQAVHNQIRGMNPWPGAHTVLGERRIKVHRTVASTLDPEGAAPGQVIALDPEAILVACAEGTSRFRSFRRAAGSGSTHVRLRAGVGSQSATEFSSGGTDA